LAAFISFRIFDIWKPFPLKKLEELPDGWGILLDDLGAAVYANILCQIGLRLLVR
jgi:phosphatidylglycerophosphatase A